jgi:hypothetical protein
MDTKQAVTTRAGIHRRRQTPAIAGVIAILWLCLSAGNSFAASSPPPLPTSPGSILDYWTFDDTNWLSGHGFPPKAFYGIQSVPGWSSNALQIIGTNALLQYHETETNGLTNIVCPNGTIWLWFLPNWAGTNSGGTGPGAYGRLLEMGVYTTNASYGWWSLYVDPSGTAMFFSAQTNGIGATFLDASMQWPSNHWHFVALTYSPTNSAIYVDGQLATNGSGVLYYPSAAVRATNGFSIGSDTSGLNLAQGQFDWLRTFNYPVDGGLISNYYQAVIKAYGGGAPSRPSGGFLAGSSGSGGAAMLPGLEGCNQNPALTMLTPKFQGTSVRLDFSPNQSQSQYDLFYSANLTTWTNLGRSLLGTTSFVVNTPPMPKAFYLLGTMQDVDGINGTDAYELLIGHTDPWSNLAPLNVFITQPANNSILP